MTLEICPICDIEGCKHIRERRADLPAPDAMACIAELEGALACALALCDTPIARRRLGIDPNTNEMLITARRALAKEPTE